VKAQAILDSLLGADLAYGVARMGLANALDDLGRHEEADLCRDLGAAVRVAGGPAPQGRGPAVHGCAAAEAPAGAGRPGEA
jgi:hypothetical protein